MTREEATEICNDWGPIFTKYREDSLKLLEKYSDRRWAYGWIINIKSLIEVLEFLPDDWDMENTLLEYVKNKYQEIYPIPGLLEENKKSVMHTRESKYNAE